MKKNWVYLLLLIFLTACQGLSATSVPGITVSITVDGKVLEVNLPANSTVQNALTNAGVVLGPLDQVTPPPTTIVALNDKIKVVRVREEFIEKTEVVPFEQRIIKNESLPEGETRLLQPGNNGERSVTYRIVYEDELEVSNLEFKSTMIKEAIPEISMVGVQAPFTPVNLSGVVAYLDSGNAWLIDGSTANRKPLITTGDLDGRIFTLSQDREWLLFTRKGDGTQGVINTLWVLRVNRENAAPIDLGVKNIIHFADFVPNSPQTVAYSTVEPRDSAPGWQANNDLFYRKFSASGSTGSQIKVMDANSGGIYGWWGVMFFWSPDGNRLAYARPDEIGTVNLKTGDYNPQISITPYETRSDWAWVPGIAWSPDGKYFYTTSHNDDGNPSKPESSTVFDLIGKPLDDETYTVTIRNNNGMFANPVTSAKLDNGSFYVAALQAIFPDQSDNSRYRLLVMDQDGSNQKILMPEEGTPGLAPQTVQWSPDFQQGVMISAIYEGNLWVLDVESGTRYQVTGSGLVNRISWK